MGTILMVVGFVLLFAGLRLMMIRNALRRTGKQGPENLRQIKREGILLCICGIAGLVVAGFSNWVNFSPRISATVWNGGGTILLLGIFQFIQYKVLVSNESDVQKKTELIKNSSLIAAGVGGVLIILTVILGAFKVVTY